MKKAASAVLDDDGSARHMLRWSADTQAADGPRPEQALEARGETDGLSDGEILELFEKGGLTLDMVTPPYHEEYRGKANQELDLIETDHATDTVLSLGPYELSRTTERSSVPDRDAGEHERCRVWFGKGGQAFVSISLRKLSEDGGEPLEFKEHYELELLRGTEADFQAGKPVLFTFSAQGLEGCKQDYMKFTEDFYKAALKKQLGKNPLTAPLADRLKVTMACQRFSNMLILASQSSVVTEEQEPTVVKLRATFPLD